MAIKVRDKTSDELMAERPAVKIQLRIAGRLPKYPDKPWAKAGVSRSTWYRRLKEERVALLARASV